MLPIFQIFLLRTGIFNFESITSKMCEFWVIVALKLYICIFNYFYLLSVSWILFLLESIWWNFLKIVINLFLLQWSDPLAFIGYYQIAILKSKFWNSQLAVLLKSTIHHADYYRLKQKNQVRRKKSHLKVISFSLLTLNLMH